MRKVASCIHSLLQLRVFRFGDQFLVQLSGIPIGGPISGAALEAVLCLGEDTFDKLGWPTLANKLNIRGQRCQWLTCLRYVDDVFVATRCFCPTCVEYIIVCIYSRTIAFDTATDGLGTVGTFTTLRFLDLWCFMSWDKIFFSLVCKNDLFAFSGLNSLRTNNRYPIPHGDMRLLYKRITCEFQSRLARFRQLGFSLDGIYFHIT